VGNIARVADMGTLDPGEEVSRILERRKTHVRVESNQRMEIQMKSIGNNPGMATAYSVADGRKDEDISQWKTTRKRENQLFH